MSFLARRRGAVGAIVLVVTLGLSGWNVALVRQFQGERGQINDMKLRLADRFHVLWMLTSPGVVKRTLETTALAPQAQVRLILEPAENAAILVAANLPSPPPGDVYQMWLGHPGTRLQAGRFAVDRDGSAEAALIVSHPLASCESAWITIEPQSGDPVPNGLGVARGSLWSAPPAGPSGESAP